MTSKGLRFLGPLDVPLSAHTGPLGFYVGIRTQGHCIAESMGSLYKRDPPSPDFDNNLDLLVYLSLPGLHPEG